MIDSTTQWLHHRKTAAAIWLGDTIAYSKQESSTYRGHYAGIFSAFELENSKQTSHPRIEQISETRGTRLGV